MCVYVTQDSKQCIFTWLRAHYDKLQALALQTNQAEWSDINAAFHFSAY